MSTTCEITLQAAVEVLQAIGVRGLGYSYQERDPTRHLNAWYLRVTRLPDLAILASLMLPHAVTKRAQWVLLAEYAASRLDGATIDSEGRVHRGGPALRAYSAREIEIAQELHDLNLRGPAAIARRDAWKQQARSL